MWQIGNPVYGWALLALVIPVVIHLYNRQRTKVKLLGSLRWVTEVQPARWHFRRIHQWPLLFIRLLLLTVIVLLLVDLSRTGKPGLPDKLHTLILIHPAAGDTSQFRQLASGWQNDSVQVRWLAPGFPLTGETIKQNNSQQLMSLLAEADWHFRPDSIHVIAPNRLMYFTTAHLPTSAPVSWELTDLTGDSIRLMWATAVNDIPELLWFRTDANKTAYWLQKGMNNATPGQPQINWLKEKQVIQVKDPKDAYEVPVTSPDTLKIRIIFNASQQNEWQTLQAAVQAIAGYHGIPLQFVERTATEADWLIYLTGDSLVTATGKTQPQLSYHPGAGINWLEPVRPDSAVIRKVLSTGQILEGGLMEALRPYILALKYKQVTVPGIDYRKTDIANTISGNKIYQTASVSGKATGKWRMYLGLLALGLIIVERIWPKRIK